MRILFQDNGNFRDEWLQALAKHCPNDEVRVWQSGDQAAADYAIVWKPDAGMLAGRENLRAIFSRGAGVDGILQLGHLLPPGVPLLRLNDAGMGAQMAEYVMHALLRFYRRFDIYQEQAAQKQWRPLPAQDRKDFPVGVLGLGVLGQKIIQGLQAFDFPVLGWSRNQKELPGVHTYHGWDQLDAFLAATKVLVCILPLTDETRGLLNRQRLAHLPKGAYLINVARGAHVVEADLLDLIQQQHLAGAYLDVFAEEPLPAAHPFWQEPRISVTPHISAITLIDQSVQQIAANMRALEQGQPVTGLVDLQRGY